MTDAAALSTNIADLANTIAGQAEAIRDGRTSGPPLAMACGLLANAEMLRSWLDSYEQIALAEEWADAQES